MGNLHSKYKQTTCKKTHQSNIQTNIPSTGHQNALNIDMQLKNNTTKRNNNCTHNDENQTRGNQKKKAFNDQINNVPDGDNIDAVDEKQKQLNKHWECKCCCMMNNQYLSYCEQCLVSKSAQQNAKVFKKLQNEDDNECFQDKSDNDREKDIKWKGLQISNNEGKDKQSYWDYIKQLFHDQQRKDIVALPHRTHSFTSSHLELSDTESSSTNSERSFTISEAYSSKNEGVAWWNRKTHESQKTLQEINPVGRHSVQHNNWNDEVDSMCTNISKCSILKRFVKRIQQYTRSLNEDDNFNDDIGLILNDFMHFLHQHDTDEEFEFISNP
eukprot:498716_1